MKKRNTIEVDSELVVKAVKKARQENIATTMTSLFGYLLFKAKNGELSLQFTPEFLNWNRDKITSIVFDDEDMEILKNRAKVNGFKPNSSFIVNLLISNYLKQ